MVKNRYIIAFNINSFPLTLDFCSSNPCHHGSCKTTSGGYKCHCLSGYHGSQCESKGIDCLKMIHLAYAKYI